MLYHPLAWTYDYVAAVVSVGRWQRWVRSAADQLSGRRVLELGYGPGHLQVFLNQLGYQVFGLDESWQMAHQASRKLLHRGLPCRIGRGLGQRLPYAPDSFDNVVATFPTQYIFQPETLSEITRVLAVHGRLVVLLAAWITGTGLADRAAALLFRVTGQVPQIDEMDEELLGSFERAGLKAKFREIGQAGAKLLFIVAEKAGG